MFSHITADSDSFAVTPDHSSSKMISALEKWSCIKNSLSLRISFSLPSSTGLSRGETEGGQVRKARLLKITRKASFASHSGACARARPFFRLCGCISFSSSSLLGFVLGRARQETYAVGCRYKRTVTIVLSVF